MPHTYTPIADPATESNRPVSVLRSRISATVVEYPEVRWSLSRCTWDGLTPRPPGAGNPGSGGSPAGGQPGDAHAQHPRTGFAGAITAADAEPVQPGTPGRPVRGRARSGPAERGDVGRLERLRPVLRHRGGRRQQRASADLRPAAAVRPSRPGGGQHRR